MQSNNGVFVRIYTDTSRLRSSFILLSRLTGARRQVLFPLQNENNGLVVGNGKRGNLYNLTSFFSCAVKILFSVQIMNTCVVYLFGLQFIEGRRLHKN